MIPSAVSKNGIPIRLTDERRAHIAEEQGELAGMRLEALENIAQPSCILAGGGGEFLALREQEPGKFLVTGMEESSRVIQEGSDALTAQAEFNERNLSEIKQDLADALKSLKNPVLIVMDDIDRLTAGEITLLFQVVKANADFPNLVYLLLFSRDRVEQSLGDLTLTDGREFPEKIVQVGFDIPLIERMRLEKALVDGLNNLLADGRITQRFDQQYWGNMFMAGLRPYFETLRDVRRFLATLAFQVSFSR